MNPRPPDADPPPPVWQTRWAGALLIAGCLAIPWFWWEWKLGPIRPRGTVAHRSFDQYHYTVPALRYAASMLRQGVVPLWNPYQLCGTPFLAAQLHGVLYPPNWIVLLLPLPQALRALLIAHAMLALAGAYWCARAFGARRPAALLAGVGYAFSGTVCDFGAASMQPLFVSMAWLPWQLGFTRRVLAPRERWWRSAAALGAAFAMPVLGGHLPCLPLAMVLCGTYMCAALVLVAVQCGPAVAARRAARLVVVGVIAAGVSAVQLGPTLELMLRSPRQPGSLSIPWALNPLPGLLPPHEFVRGLIVPEPGRLGLGGEGHIGTAPLVFSLVPLLWPGMRRRASFLWIIGVSAALIALADATPVFRWYTYLPGAALFRIPQRFTAVLTLCLALAGALGAEVLSRRRRAWEILASLLPGVALIGGLVWLLRRVDPSMVIDTDTGLHTLRNHLVLLTEWFALFALLHRIAGPRWRALLVAGVALASVVELYTSVAVEWPTPMAYPDGLRLPVAAAGFLRDHAGSTRIFAPNKVGDFLAMIPLKLGDLTGLQVISDYEPLVDERFIRLLRNTGDEIPIPGSALYGPQVSHLDLEQVPLLRLLGVGYVLIRRAAEIPVALGAPVYSDDAYQVFAVPDPFPRAYVATHVQVASSADSALDALVRTPSIVLDRGVIVDNPDARDLSTDGSVAITAYRSHSVELHAELTRPGLVVLHDQYDPFWTATVDGHSTAVLRANGVFRGVIAPAGAHTIVFSYRPTLVYAGAAMTLATLALLAATALRRRPPRPRTQHA